MSNVEVSRLTEAYPANRRMVETNERGKSRERAAKSQTGGERTMEWNWAGEPGILS